MLFHMLTVEWLHLGLYYFFQTECYNSVLEIFSPYEKWDLAKYVLGILKGTIKLLLTYMLRSKPNKRCGVGFRIFWWLIQFVIELKIFLPVNANTSWLYNASGAILYSETDCQYAFCSSNRHFQRKNWGHNSLWGAASVVKITWRAAGAL